VHRITIDTTDWEIHNKNIDFNEKVKKKLNILPVECMLEKAITIEKKGRELIHRISSANRHYRTKQTKAGSRTTWQFRIATKTKQIISTSPKL